MSRRMLKNNNGNVYTFYQDNLHLGVLVGEVFMKTVDPQYHYYRKGRGYSIASWVIDKLEELGCKKFKITEIGGRAYEISFEDFVENSEPVHHYGYEEQECVAMEHWHMTKE